MPLVPVSRVPRIIALYWVIEIAATSPLHDHLMLASDAQLL